MAFQIAEVIIKDIERHVVDDTASGARFIELLRRECFYPLRLLTKGFGIWSRDITKFSFASTLALILFLWVSIELAKSGGAPLIELMFPFFILVPLLISMFSAPSSYCFCGVKNSHLGIVTDHLERANIEDAEQISTIKESIKLFQDRVKVRVIGLRAFMVLCWTWFLYLYSQLNQFIETSKSVHPLGEAYPVAFSFLAVLFLYVAIESYSKINTLIFNSALLGCNDYQFSLVRESDGE